HVAALVERHAGERHGAVADRAEHQAAVDRLDLVVGRPRTENAVVGLDDLVAPDVNGVDATVAADLDRGAQEAEHDPPPSIRVFGPRRALPQQLDVLARGAGAVHVEPAPRNRAELDLLRIDPDIDPVHAPQLAQLRARERRLRRTSPAEHHDILDL